MKLQLDALCYRKPLYFASNEASDLFLCVPGHCLMICNSGYIVAGAGEGALWRLKLGQKKSSNLAAGLKGTLTSPDSANLPGKRPILSGNACGPSLRISAVHLLALGKKPCLLEDQSQRPRTCFTEDVSLNYYQLPISLVEQLPLGIHVTWFTVMNMLAQWWSEKCQQHYCRPTIAYARRI